MKRRHPVAPWVAITILYFADAHDLTGRIAMANDLPFVRA
jgi:hypothetical protein